MAVREVRCYNKELNKFIYLNDNLLTPEYIRRNGYAPVADLNEPTIELPVNTTAHMKEAETLIENVSCETFSEPRQKRKYTKKKK